MFARIEVGIRPELSDPQGQALLRRAELANPALRKKIRWARYLDVYWLDLPYSREEMIMAIGEVYWDRVLQWLFTGNLIPAAAGKNGGMLDLMETAPNRPGKFWGLERRFRPGVTDNVGRTAMEAFEIVLGRKPEGGRATSGGILLLEGPELDEDSLAVLSREIFVNELIESWTILPESELRKNDRFHQERVKRDLPRVAYRGSDEVEEIDLGIMGSEDLQALSQKRLLALTLEEMKAIQSYYYDSNETERRKKTGLDLPTDVEIEVLAQTWSEHCKHKIFGATFRYSESERSGAARIPAQIDSLFKTTISGTTAELPKPWLLSVFEDNAGIVAFDDEDAFCIKVETHNSPSALDPYGGALTGIVGVNRDILGCGLGAKPIFNTDVFCVAPPTYKGDIPERLMHPRRILDGVRRGVQDGGNKSGIPTVNGALVFDDRFLGKPLVFCGTGGFMPRMSAGRRCEVKEVHPGDHIIMIGGRVGKDGIHGATFSSLALDQSSPSSAVQLGDPITQKRAADFLLEAREQGLYRAITDNGAGGLSSSVGEMARLSGGARMDVKNAKTKYPGLKPYELVISESQERMTLAVPKEQLELFTNLAERRGVEVSDLGEFTNTGHLEIYYGDKIIANLDLEFLHNGVPTLELDARWEGRKIPPSTPWKQTFERDGAHLLVELLGRPNIASKEWLIRQYDHEVQGMSVVKPLHSVGVGTTAAASGPNDGSVLRPKPNSDAGLAVGCGINTRLSDIDPYLMAQAAVDEAVRNVLCVGADFGKPESVLALVDNFCWPDPIGDPAYSAALVRACFGLRDAALALSAPLVSGKDSMKNDYRGSLHGQPVKISVPPTLLMTAVAKVTDTGLARTADFKSAGDVIYILGGEGLGLQGSELYSMLGALPEKSRVGEPNWPQANVLYSWIGGAQGREQKKLRSLHDVSEGGALVAIAEGLIARNLGAKIQFPADWNLWETAFGEGFHSFIASAGELDAAALEAEWQGLKIPFMRLGSVRSQDRLEVQTSEGAIGVPTRQLRAAWTKEGYWE